MNSREEELIKHLPTTSNSNEDDSVDKSKYTNSCGLIIFPLLVFIGILYLIFS
jgi:hypothetical protein